MSEKTVRGERIEPAEPDPATHTGRSGISGRADVADTIDAVGNAQVPAFRPRVAPQLLMAVFLALYLFLGNGHVTSGDAVAMLGVTQSLVEQGRLDIPPNLIAPAQNVDPSSSDAEIAYGDYGSNGRYYSKYGLGMSLAAAPLYAIGLAVRSLGGPPYAPVFAATFLNAFVTAATVALLYGLAREMRWKRRAALGLALAFGLASPAIVYAKSTFSEPLVTLCLVAAALGLQRARRTGSLWGFGMAGLGLGGAVLTRPTAGIVIPLFVLYAAWGLRGKGARQRGGAALAFLVPLAAGIALTLWYNLLRFGSPFDLGYRTNNWQTPFFQGLYGLVLSPGKGLLWYAPPVLVALFAWPRFVRKHRDEALLFGSTVIATILFHAPYTYWEGGWCWGPRLVLTATPFAMAPLGMLLDGIVARQRFVLTVAVVLAVGLIVQLPAVLVDPSRPLAVLYVQSPETFSERVWRQPQDSPLVTQWVSVRDVATIARSPELLASVEAVLPPRGRDLPSVRARFELLPFNVFDFWWVYIRWL